jgi:hypothetical protein
MSTFEPTHRVPAPGIDSWPRPDPQAAPGPRIEEGHEVQVVDRLGDWAKVAFSNEWTAWVDGRLLVARAMATAPPSSASPAGSGSGFDLQALMADRPSAIAIGGALLLLVSSFLTWLRSSLSASSFDVPLAFLFDYQTSSDSGAKVGWLLLVLAVGVVIVVVTHQDRRIVRGVGIFTIAVGVLYMIQLQRLVGAVPGASFTDFVGLGVILAVLAGVIVTFADKLGAKRR